MADYSKEKKEILEKQKPLYEKRKQIIAEGEEKKKELLDAMTEEEVLLVKKIEKYQKTNKVCFWVTFGLGWLISAIFCACIIYFSAKGIIKWGKIEGIMAQGSWLIFIGVALIVWAFLNQIVFGAIIRNSFIDSANKNPHIKKYADLCEKTQKEKDEVEKEIKKWAEKYDQYVKWENGEIIGKIICKTVSFIEEMGNSVPDEPRSNYTHSINDGGYRKNLKLDERQGGYDTTHGWHDVYKDDHGHSWGTTDGGKTFFKKD